MSLEALFLFARRLDDGHCPTKWPVPLQLQQRPVMNFTHIRNKVKMLLTEQKMLILQFVVLIFVTIFTVLRIKKLVFFLHSLQYLQGLGTFVVFFCSLLSKRGGC